MPGDDALKPNSAGFWLMITIFGDLFRRHDISGWAKATWVIVLIVFSYIGIFVYLITQQRGMAERQSQRVQQAREELSHVIGFSVAGRDREARTFEEFWHHFKRRIHAAPRPSR